MSLNIDPNGQIMLPYCKIDVYLVGKATKNGLFLVAWPLGGGGGKGRATKKKTVICLRLP